MEALMDIPTHLNHRPIIKWENYDEVDGRFNNDTDAQGLSVGLAQWNSPNEDKPDISVKVWRHTGEKWSRQSEEIPVHRLVDMTRLLCAALMYAEKGVLLSEEFFSITSSQDNFLLGKLKKGLEKEKERNYLEFSLLRLTEVLEQLGYFKKLEKQKKQEEPVLVSPYKQK